MGIKEVDFTTHAEEKLKRLTSLGVTKEKVLEIVRNPEKIVYGHYGRRIAKFY
jgi:Fe2+ transport system protein FeoA